MKLPNILTKIFNQMVKYLFVSDIWCVFAGWYQSINWSWNKWQIHL